MSRVIGLLDLGLRHTLCHGVVIGLLNLASRDTIPHSARFRCAPCVSGTSPKYSRAFHLSCKVALHYTTTGRLRMLVLGISSEREVCSFFSGNCVGSEMCVGHSREVIESSPSPVAHQSCTIISNSLSILVWREKESL